MADKKRKKNPIVRVLTLCFMLVLVIEMCYAMSPVFRNTTLNGLIFYYDTGSKIGYWNMTQDVEFDDYIFANDTDEEYPLSFSDTSADNFTNFNMTNSTVTAARIIVTPDNYDVGYHLLYIVVTDTNDEFDIVQMRIQVANVNDPPNITDYTPSSLEISVLENYSQDFIFVYSASDPDAEIGLDNLSSDWYKNSIIQTGFGNLSNFSYVPDFCEAGSYNISLIVTDTFSESDQIAWNLTVNNTNRAPTFNSSNPVESVINITEDTPLTNYLNISEHLYDSDNLECTGNNQDSLTFSSSGESNITVTINSTTHLVSFTPSSDWVGNETITFSLYDGYDTTQSNNVTLRIIGVPDAPNLNLVNVSLWAANSLYSLSVNTTDPDVIFGDTLTYQYDVINNTFPEFSMSAAGLINFTPTSTGSHTINISVTDSYGLTDWELLYFSVKTNLVPIWGTVENQNATEGVYFTVNISAYDLDDDTITFSSNFSSFTQNQINNSLVQLSFTPSNSHVGNRTILLTVSDEYGASNTTTFILTVLDVNFAPVFVNLDSDYVAKINNTFTTYINATDSDEDSMTFYDNSTLFNITTLDASGGYAIINFDAPDSPGNYSVSISVSDGTVNTSQTVNFEITPNRPPTIASISAQVGTTGVTFDVLASASDPDNDNLTFVSDYSFTGAGTFSIVQNNLSSAYFRITPTINDTGTHNITINVSDGYGGNDSTSFTLNVSLLNHAPFFINITNQTCNIDFVCSFNMTGYDTDGQSLTFTTTPDIFSKAIVGTGTNYSKSQFNYTATDWATTSIAVNLTIDDGVLTNQTSFIITVNRPPNITSWTPTNTEVTANEGENSSFNHTSEDPDGNPLTYYWLLANRTSSSSVGTYYQQATTQNWNFTINYSMAGNYSILLVVNDTNSLNDTQEWNMTITDVNRVPKYGVKIYESYADLSGGTRNQTNLSSDGTLNLNSTGGFYSLNGTYLSGEINFGFDPLSAYGATMSFQNLPLNSSKPESTNITSYTRSRATAASEFGNWTKTNESTNHISTQSGRVLQYILNLTTENTSATPSVTGVRVNYIIANYTFDQGTAISGWIDLDDFFSDEDGETLTYGYSDVTNEGTTIQVEISNTTNVVTIYSSTSASRTIEFYARDGEMINATSNHIKLIAESSIGDEVPTATSGGGGGRTVEVLKLQIQQDDDSDERLVALDLVEPGPVTIYENDTVVIPITIKNTADETSNLTLTDIVLQADSENKNLALVLDIERIPVLEPGQSVDVKLTVTSYKTFGTYEILLSATSKEPEYTDTTKLYINSIEQGSKDENKVNTKIAFTRDLLGSNQECLELNEALFDVELEIKNGNVDKANLMLDQITEGCRFLITQKEEQKAKKENPSEIRKEWFNKLLSNSLVLIGSGILVFFLLVLLVLKTTKKKKRKPILREIP